MLAIEHVIYVCIFFLIIISNISLAKAGIAKKSDRFYFILFLSFIVIQTVLSLLSNILPQSRDSNLYLTSIYLGTIFTLLLFYVLTHITETITVIREDARVWIGWTIFLILISSICSILIGLPTTLTDLYNIPLALALCFGILYYPIVHNRLKKIKTAAEERTIEKNIEGHKESVIKLAIESWRFAKDYERILTRLNTTQKKRNESKLQQFVKKAEESLADIGLRVVNVEGYPYDPGMAATPLNIEDFEPDDHLVVDKMLEPIIMEGTTLAKIGTVTLRRKE